MKLPSNKLKGLFGEVVNGCSKLTPTCFVKHFGYAESSAIDEHFESLLNKAKSKGLPTLEEKEASIIESGDWDKGKDEQINELFLYISNLKLSKTKVFRQQDLNQIQAEIDKSERKILELRIEKSQLIAFVAESYANKKINEYYLYHALFKESTLTEPLFHKEEFEEIDNSHIEKLISQYNMSMARFNESNFKRISLCSFFTNFFYLCDDNPMTFFGKPIVNLTFYQAELFGYGRYFKNLLSQSETTPPQELFEEPEKLIEYLTSSGNAKALLDKNPDSTGVSLVGLNKEDYAKLGIQNSDNKKLVEAVKKAGGAMGFQDFITLHKK